MKTEVINKIIVSEEAKLDYKSLTDLKLPQFEIKQEMEQYIDFFIGSKADDCYNYYFRAKYYIEDADKMFMFFIYKDKKFGKMQMWRLAGICFEEDWSEELEYSGQIRFWLNTKIVNLPDEIDWVVKLRLWEESNASYIQSYSLTGVTKEVKYAITSGGYDPYSKKYDYLSHDDGEWNGKQRGLRKNGVSRKEHKSATRKGFQTSRNVCIRQLRNKKNNG